jgi:hypothetical protein
MLIGNARGGEVVLFCVCGTASQSQTYSRGGERGQEGASWRSHPRQRSQWSTARAQALTQPRAAARAWGVWCTIALNRTSTRGGAAGRPVPQLTRVSPWSARCRFGGTRAAAALPRPLRRNTGGREGECVALDNRQRRGPPRFCSVRQAPRSPQPSGLHTASPSPPANLKRPVPHLVEYALATVAAGSRRARAKGAQPTAEAAQLDLARSTRFRQYRPHRPPPRGPGPHALFRASAPRCWPFNATRGAVARKSVRAGPRGGGGE